MPNIEYRGHVTLPVVPARDWATVNRNDYDARMMRWIISGNGNMPTTSTCNECERVFNMSDEIDAQEWTYGHDCEN